MRNFLQAVVALLLIMPLRAYGQSESDPSAQVDASAKEIEAPKAEVVPEDLPGLDDLMRRKEEDVTDAWKGPGPSSSVLIHPWFEHHGYFRTRLDGFYRAHLGTDAYVNGTTIDTSAFSPPVTNNYNSRYDQQGEDWLGGANIRLRYEPVIHINNDIFIHTQFDILDNLMFGSTPEYDPSNPAVPLTIFSTTQSPATGNRFSFKDSVTVKEAWASWAPINPKDAKKFMLSFNAGRMARHWGLGLVENAGDDLDDDYGTYADRINLLSRILGVYVELGYSWVSSGPNSTDATRTFGEPHDLTNTDDVFDVSLAIFSRPDTEMEKKVRYQRLYVQNKPVFDWGLYLTFRRQDLDQNMENILNPSDSSLSLLPSYYDISSYYDLYETYSLEDRGAWILSPDIWFKMEWKPSSKELLRIELELAGSFGHIDHVPRYSFQTSDESPAGDWVFQDVAMDIQSLGGAIEVEYVNGQISSGLMAGFATGTDSAYFGYADFNNYLTDPSVTTMSSFYFHPDYQVDELLFRHALGTVTDAWYVKPFVQYDLFEGEKDALAGRLEVLYGRAIESSATPGLDPNLGVEIDVHLFYESMGMFFVGLDWGTLWPLAGMNLSETWGCYPLTGENSSCHESKSAQWAMSIRGRLGVRF